MSQLEEPQLAPPGGNGGNRPPGSRRSFTGRRRQRKTRPAVKIADLVARCLITAGGLGVVVMFAAIVGFLISVAVPLFTSAAVEEVATAPLPLPETSSSVEEAPLPVAMGVDEMRVALWVLDSASRFSMYRLSGAELISTQQISDVPVTAVAERRGALAIARADGTIQLGEVGFATSFTSELSDSAESLAEGQTIIQGDGIAEMVRGRLRITRPNIELADPVQITDGDPSPAVRMDYLRDSNLEALAAVLEDGRLFVNLIRKQQNMMTGKVTTRLVKHELPRSSRSPPETPLAVLLGKNARHVYLVYPNGHLTRYDTSDPNKAVIAEETDLTPDDGAALTSAAMLLGNVTIIAGDAEGGVTGWFAAPFGEGASRRERATTTDGLHMVRAHVLPAQAGAITAITASHRDRQFITGDATGQIVLRHMTSEATQARLEPFDGQPIRLLALAPKNNALGAISEDGQFAFFDVDNPHPDGSVAAMLAPVHYEGRAESEHFWQSSAGTDSAELKFGLIPLIFGTIKATVYAMVFAVPLAILAAIYSSEFMQPQTRSVVKPVVELMAGLPSVVLGFIAALVLAPFVENVVPAVLLTFVAVPVGVMVAGFLWQLVPPRLVRTLPGWLPFVLMIATVVLMVVVAFLLGPVVERVLFYGDFRAWVDSRVGTGRLGGTPGWIILLTPLFGVALVIGFNLGLRHRLGLYDGRRRTRTQLAVADLLRFVATGVAAVGLAALVGAGLSAVGLDLRGTLFDTYVQRNALNVGIIMGFAIIPIIYTVSEDALSSVPNTLRSAAYGAGATPWQTAVRVVLPVAASGIFSACMIGFGRAAGETMIVLMAAGNTPLMEWNLFNGMRTLSANIAVELPEAAVGSTHYRVLYLSALVLFAITFLVNTTAEMVRIRFRKRAFQL